MRTLAASALVVLGLSAPSTPAAGARPAITTLYRVAKPRGLMVTSGGWAYCQQVRRLARRTHYTLLCGRYAKDGYLGPALRAKRHLDWGNPAYLAGLAEDVAAARRKVGGALLLIGISYSGFGVATLAAHHPEIRPDRLIVIDSYFDLVARRRHVPDKHETAREIDRETGGSLAALRRRSAGVAGLGRLVRGGTRLEVIWTVSEEEKRFFGGATCDRSASARTLARLARKLRRPLAAWVTRTRHGHNLWNHGMEIVKGKHSGRRVVFPPSGRIPADSTC